MPLESFERKWRLPLIQLALGCLLALLTGLVAAAILSRKILVPIRALTRHVDEISAGRPSSLAGVRPTIDEFETLRKGMANYETALTQQAGVEREVTQDLRESERRYRAVAEAGAMVFWTGGLDGKLLSATGWEDLTGQPESQALGSGWMKFVHPEDLKQRKRGSTATSVDGRFQDTEFRIRAAGGHWRWVRTRATLIEEDGRDLEWVGVLEDVDARRRAQDELAHMALHDELTGLGNRNMLGDRLERMIAAPGKISVICLDLDRFKEVNDTLGHSQGDELLKQVATRIRNCAAPDDLIVRLGGDEFAVARSGDASMHDIATLAGRLITKLSEPYQLGAASVIVGASAGIADAADTSAEELMRQADIALYAAKAAGRRQFRFFEPGMYAKLQRRGQVEAELRKAIELNQLLVHYQPLVNPVTCLPTGFEALLRWNHPERGLLLPDRFITIAEETGLIDEIGKKVLNAACREAAGWPDKLKVSVNISPVQLADKRLAESVLSALTYSGLDASRLELEITENALVENIEQGMATLLRLKALGCGVVMDDFGSGGSSLEFLKAFPFSRVKIDKAFVQNLEQAPENRAIVSAVTSICTSLGIKSTGEGVETPEQLAILLSVNCSEVQGYLFGRPSPAEDVEAVVKRLTKEAPMRMASAASPTLKSA